MTKAHNLYDALLGLKDNRFLTPRDKELLEDFIKQAKEKSDYFHESSKILRKKQLLLNLAPEPSIVVTRESIAQFFQLVKNREIEKGYPEPIIDAEIWESILPNVQLQKEKEFSMQLYCFLRHSISYYDLLEEGKKHGIGKIYSFLNALVIARQIILEGSADGIPATVIYCNVDGSPIYSPGAIFCLCVHRLGHANKQLQIKMRLYNASKNKPALYQVCFD